MYDYVIPPLLRGLSALSGLLTKAEAHCTEHNIKPEAILDFRLYPDMLSFTRQVQLTCDFAARLPARLCVEGMPSFPDTETSFAELQTRIYHESQKRPTYNVRETLELIDRAYIIYDGKMLMEGTPRDIVNNPDVRRVYLGEQFDY